MATRPKAILLAKRSKVSALAPWVDGDLASEVHRQALLLTTALNGLRLEEGEFDHREWVDRITPMFLLGLDLEEKAGKLRRQAFGEQGAHEDEA